MIVSHPIFAEVSDKMMSWPTLWCWVIGIPLLAWALIRKKKWLAVLPLPFALLLALGSVEEWRDPHIGPAVIHELGYSYLILGFVPLMAIIFLLLVVKKRANKSVQTTAMTPPPSTTRVAPLSDL